MRKWLMSCVFPGVEEVFANSFLPVSMLIKDDLPTLERPINANSGYLGGGHFLKSAALEIKIACLISMPWNIQFISGNKPVGKYFIEFFWAFHHRSMPALINPKQIGIG